MIKYDDITQIDNGLNSFWNSITIYMNKTTKRTIIYHLSRRTCSFWSPDSFRNRCSDVMAANAAIMGQLKMLRIIV